MNTATRWAIGAVGLGVLLAGCASSPGDIAPSEPGTSTTTSAPATSASAEPESPFAFEAATVAGGTVDGETLRGHDVILWFWAPWCPTCMVEGKEHVADAIARMPEGVEFVGVAGRSDDFAAMEEFLEWTGTGDATHVADVDGAIWEAFGVLQQPAFLFVNDDGTGTRAGSGLSAEDIVERAEELASS
ncbi:redoxin family protein [Demequina muriae]|uniref:Redoxin family protein n=1 Tax=Demequina muriae TaxID=3051664 RepID=A0ABT8GGS3_9MICO|nr:redoxin family protein [Demequina sp. EGI L300058]MDN4480471.1 redoxin family protein [Demequina sp. EGI L300058]